MDEVFTRIADSAPELAGPAARKGCKPRAAKLLGNPNCFCASDPEGCGSVRTARVDLGPLPGMLGYMLHRVQSAAVKSFDEAVGKAALSPNHYALLTIVRHNQGLSQSCLAQSLGLDRSSMVAALDQLEGEGLVERRKDPNDRRRHAIHLTDAGERQIDAAADGMAAHEQALLRALKPKERETLTSLLGKVLRAIG